MKTIVKSIFNIDDATGDQQSAAYDSSIDGILQTRFLDDRPFARLKACRLGQAHLIELRAAPRFSERTPARIAADHHDGISAQLAVVGVSRGEGGGRKIVSAPGTVTIFDFGQPFWMRDEGVRDVINVAFPRGIIGRNVTDPRALHGLVLDVDRSAVLAAHLMAIAPRLETMPVYAAPVLADIILDLLLLALDDRPARDNADAPDRRAVLGERARQLVDLRIGSADLTPEWLIAKLNVSRSELYSLFEPYGGVARFIWRRRLELARQALLDPHDVRRIGEIGFAFGFSSEAHFARAFKAAFGKTAGMTRRDLG